MQTDNQQLSYRDRQAWAAKAMEGVSDEALQKLVKEGGIRELVKSVKERTAQIGEGMDTLGALALLAQAYMEERRAEYERKQERLPAYQRVPISAKDIYPEGFSMAKAKEEFRTLRVAPLEEEVPVTSPVDTEVASSETPVETPLHSPRRRRP
jgi:hypothetical protein